ncbi:hypothetical protein ACQ4PT_027297 [Festuca glaucescens]
MNGDGGRGDSTQGGAGSTQDEGALAAAVAILAMLGGTSLQGDAMVRALAEAGLGMEPAVVTKGTEGPARNSFDADFLQQTVQAVVAAVTAATKVTEAPTVHPPPAAIGVDSTGGAATGVAGGQQLGAPVAVSNPSVQQMGNAQVVAEGNEIAAKGKENEGQGPPPKKKDDKAGCFRYSDMFIRRGFFKLRFEVEIEDQSKEVNMVDANNGLDGNDGANQEEGKYEGGHDMDTDNRGNDMEDTSKNDEQDDSHTHNGVDGMQEQLCNLDAIQIGTMHVKRAPTDTRQRECPSGSVAVGYCQAAIGQQLATGPSGSVGDCPASLHAANGAAMLHSGRQQPLSLPVRSCPLTPVSPCVHGSHAAGSVGHLQAAMCGSKVAGGLSVPTERRSAASGPPLPQKIKETGTSGAAAGIGIGANHWPLIGTAAPDSLVEGSAVHGNVMDKGLDGDCLISND